MAGKKISELIEVQKLKGTEYLVLQEGNTNKKIKSDKIATKESLDTKADEFKVVEHGISDTTFELTPNTFHKWGEVTSLTLTLATPLDNTIVNEYVFQFESGTNPTTLILPEIIKFINGEPTIESSKTYQISIVNNIAVIGGV